ncbi:MAG: sialate O-acetylesterase, partial [Candidatus Latescibacteria bacterium]|nr:sialate O-acetylesterase [Candidatus Latescibacterota bacterium]
HTIRRIPAGGLYRLETRLATDDATAEWSLHGDTLHHLGVGDLWIIAGQSNAAGYGRGPGHDPPELGVHILKNNEQWDIAAHPLNDTTGSTHPNLENANPGHSPYLRFAKELKEELGYPIGLIQTSLGGSPLSAWNPREGGDAPLFDNLMHCCSLAGGRVRGMVWYQGESDCGAGLCETYEERFGAFVSALREDLGSPSLPVIVAQLNRYLDEQDAEGHRGWSLVREAQRCAPKIGSVAVVSCMDLPISDPIHTSTSGNILLGSRKARAALGMAYGLDIGWQSANVVSGHLGAEGNALTLTFENVANRLEFLGPGTHDFSVEDEAGSVPVQKAECIDTNSVKLQFSRTLSGSVRVHGGYGSNPSCNLRDAETNEPILGFYGFTVSR